MQLLSTNITSFYKSITRSCLQNAIIKNMPFTGLTVRGKKSISKSRTKNISGFPKGKKHGPKVFDGLRVPEGTLLVNQKNLSIFPGWNVFLMNGVSLHAHCHGRVLFTTEKCIFKKDDKQIQDQLSHLKNKKTIFKIHVHVIPDEQHSFFKLNEQI